MGRCPDVGAVHGNQAGLRAGRPSRGAAQGRAARRADRGCRAARGGSIWAPAAEDPRRARLRRPHRGARHAAPDGALRSDVRAGGRPGDRRGHARRDPAQPAGGGELPRHRGVGDHPIGEEEDCGGRWGLRVIEEKAMRPFQEFRFWTRRAPTAERITAGVGALLCVVLLAWLLVPGSGPKSTNLAASGGGIGAESGTGPGAGAGAGAAGAGAGAGGAGATGAAGTGGAAGAVSKAGAVPGASSPTGGPGLAPGCPAANGVTGVTATETKIAVTLTNIVGPAA